MGPEAVCVGTNVKDRFFSSSVPIWVSILLALHPFQCLYWRAAFKTDDANVNTHTVRTILSALTDSWLDKCHVLKAWNTGTLFCWRAEVLNEPHLSRLCYSTVDKQSWHKTLLCQRRWKTASNCSPGFEFKATLKSGFESRRAFLANVKICFLL